MRTGRRAGVTVRWVACAALALGCGEEAPAPPAEPPGPPAAATLETVDLCEGGDTPALLRDVLREGGPSEVVAWLRDRVRLPANLRYCDPGGAPQVLTQAVRLTVSVVRGGGQRGAVLHEAGTPLAALPLGMRSLSFDVFGEPGGGPDVEGVRVSVHYHGG